MSVNARIIDTHSKLCVDGVTCRTCQKRSSSSRWPRSRAGSTGNCS